MKILWFTWKDKKHPEAGGAEFVNEELAKKLVQEGHEVIFLVGGFKGGKKEEIIDGYKVIRLGNRYTVYLKAGLYYLQYLKGWPNLIIEEVNTIPFMTQWYSNEKRVLLIYQLCREIWFYQFFFPLNSIGYLLEPLYLWLLRKNTVLTESQSTKDDLQNYGFKKNSISVFPVSIDIQPVEFTDNLQKYETFTVLSLGAIRAMKQTLDQIKAFEIAKQSVPGLQLKIAGASRGGYGEKVLTYIEKSPHAKDIAYIGRVDIQKKIELMQKSHLILVSSVKEGWGLIVTEAASQGTPAVVYDTDGLRDSVADNKTGIVVDPDPESMAKGIIKIYNDQQLYKNMQKKALNMSKVYNSNRSFSEFKKILSDY